MGLVMLQILGLVLKVCAFVSCLALGGSAGNNLSPFLPPFSSVPLRQGMLGPVSNGKAFRSISPSPVSHPNGTGVPPTPFILQPPTSSPMPEIHPVSSPSPSPPFITPPNTSVSPPVSALGPAPRLPSSPPQAKPELTEPPAQAPAPVLSPSRNYTQKPGITYPPVPVAVPPKSNSHKIEAPESNSSLPAEVAPVRSPLAQRRKPKTPTPTLSPILPEEPPSTSPVPPPRELPVVSPPYKSVLPEVPPSSHPEHDASPPASTPPPSINWKRAATPVAAPPRAITSSHNAPVNHSPVEAPSVHETTWAPSGVPPNPSSKNSPENRLPPASPPLTSSQRHHHQRNYKITPAPSSVVHPPPPPPPPSQEHSAPAHHPKPDPKINLRHGASPPSNEDSDRSLTPGPSPTSPSSQIQVPFVSPKSHGSSARNSNVPRQPPFQALPPPPPQKDCAPLTCTEPLTFGLPEAPCICVLPIQVGLRLGVALYTFFPLVSELAAEISAGVFMKKSQVRIMGANAAGQNPEKTIVLVDLVPLGERFDPTTAYLTFQRFWHKQVVIRSSLFGDYDVLYVHYPGLPPSPPLPPSSVDSISGRPYLGSGNNGSTQQPLGVDVRGKQRKDAPNRSVIAVIVLSASVAIIVLCVIMWVLFFRHRDCAYKRQPTPTTVPSLAKSSGIAASPTGSGPPSASFSLDSSMAAYTGSAKKFSSADIERATDHFSETRILGEGGFGRVYSGVLDDGTKVAVKILKRDDQQGGREFLAEVEMLSRLHHRNLVKLIGICIEERTRCLVYELIPNGSVESHLHGIDKLSAPLDWDARLKIALGAARALSYLHEDSSPRVIHRDFKSSNILLEEDFTPKVSDFGLARTALDEESRHISTRVMGTFGYVAPEYAMTGHLLVKSDVYSYGVVLLELLTGRKPVDMSQPPGQENLVSWARPLLTSKEGLELIIDPYLGPSFPWESIERVAAIASMCVQPEVQHRPFMGEVVQALKLVCNECDETKEFESRSCSQGDFSVEIDARISTTSDCLPDPLLTQSPGSNYDYGFDIERNHSTSEMLHSNANCGTWDSQSFRRHSSSGPLGTAKAKQLWRKMRRYSGGSISEYSASLKLWPGSQ